MIIPMLIKDVQSTGVSPGFAHEKTVAPFHGARGRLLPGRLLEHLGGEVTLPPPPNPHGYVVQHSEESAGWTYFP